MDKFIKNFNRAFGVFIIILGALTLEKYLDTMEVVGYGLKPLIFIFLGLIVYFYNRD